MTVIIDKSYGVSLPEGNVLGYVGEHILRSVRFIHPQFEGAYYGLKLDYGEGVVYEVSITDGVMPVYGSLLAEPGTLEAQFYAEVEDEEGGTDRVFESEVFTLMVGRSIPGSEITPIPTYEEAQDILVQLRAVLSSAVADTRLSTQALTGIVEENIQEG